MLYFVVAQNRGRGWLVIRIMVDGPADVVGSWDDQTDAEKDANRWTALEAQMAA